VGFRHDIEALAWLPLQRERLALLFSLAHHEVVSVNDGG
jgi:hypothetical protein